VTAAESQELGRLAGILDRLVEQTERIEAKLDKKPNSERIDALEGRVKTLEDKRGSLANWAVATLTTLLVSGALLVAHVLFNVG
jgi:hypothetical protein